MKYNQFLISCICFFTLLNNFAIALETDHDFQIWSSISLKKMFNSKMSSTLEFQERQNMTISAMESFFTDLGVERKFLNTFALSFNYRYSIKNDLEYYSSRHRLYADIKFKRKYDRLNFNLRQRFQMQVSNYNSSETGKYPDFASRTKFVFKYEPNGRYKPYAATEIFYSFGNNDENKNEFSRLRYETGIDYDFNLIHSLNVFVMYQENINETTNDVISGIGYTYTF